MKSLAVVLALLVGLLGPLAHADQAERSWRVYLKLTSGQNNFCIFGGHFWAREGKGIFKMFNPENRVELFSLPMAADGSVAGEIKFPGSNRPWRVTIPAGSAPREFDILDLAYACRYRMQPM